MLEKSLVEKILNEALSTGGDFAEIFVEKKNNCGLFMIDGKIESSLSGRDFGIGIRIFKDLYSVYGYTNDMTEENLLKTARKIAEAVKGTRADITINLLKQDIENYNKIEIYPETVLKKNKIDIMRRGYFAAKEYDSEISQVRVSYSDSKQNILVANSEGIWAEDERVRGRIRIESVASNGTEMQTGSMGPGASKGFEFFEKMDVESYGREASRIAKTILHADYSPSGKMPVIIDLSLIHI